MKEMKNGINIDKWRKLNKELFSAYIRMYINLSKDSTLSPGSVMIEALGHFNILLSVTESAYGSVYTIAREIGVFYEDDNSYFTGTIAKRYNDNEITFADYMKHYVLNVEFLIYNKVVHPFEVIISALKNGAKTIDEIITLCPSLVNNPAENSTIKSFKTFVDRCCLSELIEVSGEEYKIPPKYNLSLILGSITKSNLSISDFENKYIKSKDARSNKSIVEMINQKIPTLLHTIPSASTQVEVKKNSFSEKTTQVSFDITTFISSLRIANITFPTTLPYRFVSALQTKPFLILTGLSGSGKTKLAEAFSHWISEGTDQYQIVSVGADWTNREPLLGFPNALEPGSYVKPDSGVLDLILRAKEDETKPYFLLLDEMNMSHVERYFADFLSAMESSEGEITLHPTGIEWEDCDVPSTFKLPKNLFIIGTVNIDETTYMFSPKVLDRANVIEFRVSRSDMEKYFQDSKPLDMLSLVTQGATMGKSFLETSMLTKQMTNVGDTLIPFFVELEKIGAEFGYRTASEMSHFIACCSDMAKDKMDYDQVIDAAIIQKLLPKVHGSRSKIESTLIALENLCMNESSQIKYPLSHEKLQRMKKRVQNDGFTSFAEA